MNINGEQTRIAKLRTYLFGIIDTLLTNKNYQINGNMLSNDPINYSLDKIPMSSEVETWITGLVIHRDVYSLRSRMFYSQDVMSNLQNIGFFEKFEDIIKSNNREGILPDINGIESIACLNCGTMINAETDTAEFDIQIQIVYRESEEETVSL